MAEKNTKSKLNKTKTTPKKNVATKSVKTKSSLKEEKKVVQPKKTKETITKNVKKVAAKKLTQVTEKIVAKEIKTKKFEFINIIAIIAIIIIIAAIGIMIDKNNQKKVSSTKTVEAAQSINYDCSEGKSALDVLKEKAEVKTIDSTYGVYVDQINNTANNNGSFWIFYVNGLMADVDPAQYQCKPNDKIEWRYEKIL